MVGENARRTGYFSSHSTLYKIAFYSGLGFLEVLDRTVEKHIQVYTHLL